MSKENYRCMECKYNYLQHSLKMRHCKKCDNFDDKVLKVDVIVLQRPVSVKYECPHCEEEIEMDYTDFCDIAGECCDWKYTEIQCPKCGKTIEIDDNEWD